MCKLLGKTWTVLAGIGVVALLADARLAAEEPPPAATPPAAVVDGRLDGVPAGTPVVVRRNHTEQTALVDEAGRFRFEVAIARPTYVEVEIARPPKAALAVYVVPGQGVSLICDATDCLRSLRVTGARAAENALLARLVARYGQIDYRKLFGAAEPEAMDLVRAHQKDVESLITAAAAGRPALDPEFLRLERARVQYWAALIRFRRTGRAGEWDAFAAGLKLEDPSLLGVDTYTSLLYPYTVANGFARLASDAGLRRSVNQQTEARYAAAVATFSDPAVRSRVLYEVMRNHFTEGGDGPFGCKGIDDLVARFRRDSTDAEERAEIEDRYHRCLAGRNAPTIRPYKVAAGVSLDAHVFPPAGAAPREARPAFLFFHGGGWAAGMPEWGYDPCRHYAERGLVAISFEYRLRWRHGTTPIESVEDAKSAVRWVRAHAGELGVDPKRIVVAGFSAGGHLAAATAFVPGFDDPADDRAVSAVPAAVVLLSAAVDVAQDNWMRECLAGRGRQRELSPAENVRGGLPPAIVFHGRDDDLCPHGKTAAFCERLKQAGNRCDLHSFPGGHFRTADEWRTIMNGTDEFLASLGLLPAR